MMVAKKDDSNEEEIRSRKVSRHSCSGHFLLHGTRRVVKRSYGNKKHENPRGI